MVCGVLRTTLWHYKDGSEVWGSPFDLLLEEMGRDIGNGLGEVLQVDLKAFSSDQARFIRGVPTLGSGSRWRSSTQSGNLPKGGSFDGALADGCVAFKKDVILTVKNHIPVFEELITKIDRAIQTDSDFSNSKATPTDCVPDNSVISFDLIEVVVMDEDTVILNRDLMGIQVEQKSPLGFEGSKIGFKVGCGNGNKNTSKGRPKRSGNQDKSVSQSLHGPKNVESVEESTIGSPKTMKNWKRLTTRPQILNSSSIVDVELGHKRKQTENLNREATGVKGEKKHRIVENEQGAVARRILEKLPSEADSRLCFSQDTYIFHILRSDGLSFLCMANNTFGRRIPFSYLEDIHMRFMKNYGRVANYAPAYAMNDEFSRVLHQQMEFFSSNPSADTLNRVRGEIRTIMVENIEKILERGDRIELLVDKTATMQDSAFHFKKQSKRLRRALWMKNAKLLALLTGLIVVLLYIIIAICCGGITLPSCGS
ncbi:vesicle-associated membrane protein 714 [Quercus suber]|uniref:Vesicle-associated membrane protein 714 n=1 Tax=Quercus suber TaxID=58331 RepID=A0AAW0LSH5_QUESU